MIKVSSLKKTYKLSKQQKKEMGKDFDKDTIEALKGISFQCRPGRVFTLLGPNGAGKTTALRIIAGILKPSEGSIEIGGYNIEEHPLEVKRKMGFLTGSTGLYDRLTPSEIVDYYGSLYDMDKNRLKERKEYLFDLLDINSFADRRIGRLSTGMKQKVSIARTIIHDPEIVVFDEPTSGLDVITARNIIKLIRDCKEEGKTVIFSTHILAEVHLLCDDLAVIHKGEIIKSDNFSNFKSEMKEETLEDEFIRIIEEVS